MSGGQRQRIAMGRAIVRDPKVFCMDEPLSNLDAKLRVSTRSQIAGLQRRLGTTTVYVTHDQVEAMTMGHRVAVLRDGRLQQVATPEELYERPVNTFVASFIGSPAITMVESAVDGGTVDLYGSRVALDRTVAARVTGKVVVGLRPEAWHAVDPSDPDGIDLIVDLVEALGAESFVYGTPRSMVRNDGLPEENRVTVRLDRRSRLQPGDVLRVAPQPTEMHVFDQASGESLR
jgi:sn-glycerol 3-phosphate transport system ATP-binding protein/multiple sugar transport system ATP-binding protein